MRTSQRARAKTCCSPGCRQQHRRLLHTVQDGQAPPHTMLGVWAAYTTDGLTSWYGPGPFLLALKSSPEHWRLKTAFQAPYCRLQTSRAAISTEAFPTLQWLTGRRSQTCPKKLKPIFFEGSFSKHCIVDREANWTNYGWLVPF